MKKRLKLLTVALTSLLLLPGCGGTLETLLQGTGTSASDVDSWVGASGNSVVPATANAGEGQSVALYFADATGTYLVKEERTIPKTLSMARETINQWLIGPAVKDSNIQAAVSPSTKLNDVKLKDGVLTIDLSKEFSQAYGKVSQEVSVYGLVNTMTQFSTIKEVELRVDGKSLTKLGNLDLSHLVYKGDLIKGSVSQNAVDSGKTQSGNTSTNSSANTNDQSKNTTSDSPSNLNLFSSPGGTT